MLIGTIKLYNKSKNNLNKNKMNQEEKGSNLEDYKKYLETLPKKRMASGVIIRDIDERILMVKPSYKLNLEIPGGVVEKDESPYDACKRELKEEVGLDLIIERMLCVDYNKADDKETESLMFIFYGGCIEKDIIEKIRVDGEEILSFEFMSLEELKDKATDSLYRRIEKSIEAIERQTIYYLENQLLVT